MEWEKLRINTKRLEDNFEGLAAIGATGDGGVHRPALSEAHLEARAWLGARIQAAGLELRVDGAGNHSGFLACGPQGAPTLLLGSHLDSVPYGGRFDGPLGVLAALEVVQTVKENALTLPFHLEVIDFTDEEGTLVGLLGSAALAGKLKAEDLLAPRGGRQRLEEGLARAGLSEVGMLGAARPPQTLAGYLELHIEQGKRLETSGTDIGIVSAIVGICSYRLRFIGRADHAGTTSMSDRLDASLGASEFTLAARRLVMEGFPQCVVNVGDMEFEPGAYNIVPQQVTLALEFRSPEAAQFKELEEKLLTEARRCAEPYGLGLEIEFQGRHQPAPMSQVVQGAYAAACERLGLSHTSLPSFAGHDPQSLADLCPVGMVFVPSVKGTSHAPGEFTEWQDCLNGAGVLLQTVLELAQKTRGGIL